MVHRCHSGCSGLEKKAKPEACAIAIVVAFVVLGALYSLVVPLFEAPDEVWHYLYVKHFADGGGLPVYHDGVAFPMRQEASQPPLFYVLNGWATAWIDTSDAEQIVRYNPHAAVGTAAPWGNRNMVAHSSKERYTYRGTVLAVRLARFLSILMGAGTVLCTWAVGRRLFPSPPWLPLAATALVAFNPQFLFINASVNNDVLVTLLSALTLWLLVCIVYDGASVVRLITLGILLGLAALTKLSGLLLLPLAALVFVALGWQRRSLGLALRLSVWPSVTAAVIAGWWYVRNWLLYRDLFGLKLMFAVLPARARPPTFDELLHVFNGVFKSFWGVFGWFNIPMEQSVYVALALLTLLGMLGLVRFALRCIARGQRGSLVRCGFLLLWVLVFLLGSVGWSQVSYPQGRLLFPAMPAIAVLLSLGLGQWLPRRYLRLTLAALLFPLFCLALVAPFRYIAPAYARSATLSPEERRAISSHSRWSANFGEQIRLVGYELSSTTVTGGTTLWVTLYWEALKAVDTDYSVFIHLVDDRGAIIAQRDSWPGAGNDPTSDWQVGQVKRDVHPLYVPLPLLAQAPCRIRVGLYEYTTGQRVSVYFWEGRLIDFAELPVELGLEPRSGTDLEKVRFEFGGRIALVGFSVQPMVVRPGEGVQIVLRWQAVKALDEDYTVFVHLMRGSDQIWGQSDHIPRSGQAPTSRWVAGQIVTESFDIQVGEDAPEDYYKLLVGLYHSRTLQRLQLPSGLDFVVLGQIDVRRE